MPFPSVNDLFEYAAGCRWFVLWPYEDKSENENENEKGSEQKARDTARSKLKSNDRQRMRQRPIFARWVEEFVPGCQASGRFVAQHGTPDAVRDAVRAAAFREFPGTEEAYVAQLAAWSREKTRVFVKGKLIKQDMALPDSISYALPRPQEGGGGVDDIEKCWRGVLRSALTKIVLEDDEGFEGIVPPRKRDQHGVLVVDDVKEWIMENWEAVGRVAWKQNCTHAAESFRRKKESANKETTATKVGASKAEHEGAGAPSDAWASAA